MDIGQIGSALPNATNACDKMHHILALLKVHFYDTRLVGPNVIGV